MTKRAARPNVLWISTHDINPHLGCYRGIWPGAEWAHTPHLDSLAAEGLRFDQAIAAAPVCGPSRSAIMTGCFPASIGTMHMRTRAVPPDHVQLLPMIMRAAGYWTGNSSFTDFQMDVPGPTYDGFGEQVHWRDRANPDQPFFLAVHGMVTHESQLHVDQEQHLANTHAVQPEQRQDPSQLPVPPYHPDTDTFRAAWGKYYELISQMDHWVGRWLADLVEDGLVDNTIVVFWSDHGVGLPGAKRWASEAGVREPLIMRWPAQVSPGVVNDVVSLMDLAPTTLAMCDIEVPASMQGQVIIGSDGQVRTGLRPYAFSSRDRMGEQEDRSRTVRDRRFRYTRHWHADRPPMGYCEYPDQLSTWAELRSLYAAEAQRQLSLGKVPNLLTPRQRRLVASSKPLAELYDIAQDPFEEKNLIDDPAMSGEVARLSAALDQWLAEVGDLAEVDEVELLAQWRPEGRMRHVEPPVVLVEADLVRARCDTAGAVIGWTTIDPGADEVVERPVFSGYGETPGRWQLYQEPLNFDGPLWFRAWRIGWQASPVVTATPT